MQSVFGTAAILALLVLAYYELHAALYVALVSATGVMLFLFCLRRPYREEMAASSLLCVVAMPVLAWLLPKLSLTGVHLLHLTMCLWVPLFAGRRERTAPVWLFSMLLLPGLDMPVSLGSLKLFDFGVQDALAVGAAVAIRLRPPGGPRRVASDGWVLALLLLLGICLSRETSATNFLRTTVNLGLDLGLPYYILSRGIADVAGQRTALRWLACGGIALSMILLFETWRSWPIYNELYGLYNVPMILLVKARGGLLRAGGPFVEPTSIALVLAMCFAALSQLREDFRSRLKHVGLLAIAFLGVSAPQSRGAWIGLALAVVAMAAYRGRWWALLLNAGGIGLVLGFVFVTAKLSPGFAEMLGLSDGGASDTTTYRGELFEKGRQVFWLSPLVGHSMPSLNVLMAELRQGEGIIDFVNTYLWIALIGGAAGLAIFIGNFADPLVSLWRRRSALHHDAQEQGQGQGQGPAAFVFGCLVMLCEMLFFTSFGGRPAFLTFGLFGLGASIMALRPQQQAYRWRRSGSDPTAIAA